MSQENIALVRTAYDAFRARDIAAVFRLLDAAAEFYQSSEVPWGGRYEGQEQIGAYFKKIAAAIDSKVELERLVDAGDHVVAVGRTSGSARSTGKTFDSVAVHVWTLREGKVVRFASYIDHPPVLKALEA